MVTKKSFFFGFLLVLLVFFVSFSSASVIEFGNCANYSSINGGTKGDCNSAGCLWTSNDLGDIVGVDIDMYDPFCDLGGNCCIDNGCFQFDSNETKCNDGTTPLGDVLNCSWDPFMNIFLPNGSVKIGGCIGTDFRGMDSGCWNFEADKASCSNIHDSSNCVWQENDANQNPWCPIRTLTDARDRNPDATISDIGCCEQTGCWNYDGDQVGCEGALGGLCSYDTFGGFCNNKWCGEVTTEENCTALINQLYMPCNWTGTACEEIGGGGFDMFNDTDSCFSAGGWYNESGSCIMPEDNGFMFAGESHCWFADNKPTVCGNITGCVYCDAGSGVNGVDNATNNICYNKQANICEGHDDYDHGSYANADGLGGTVDNSVNLNCSHIQIKSACNFGPLPNCVWTNSSNITGPYCQVGTSSSPKSAPPVPYCDHPDSKNNFTLCNILANDYMMPCVWDNSSYPVKNCTFNSVAVFGMGGDNGFEDIGSEGSCTAAGGTWNEENYIEEGILKTDSWCEMTGFFNLDEGVAAGNKGNCDTSCWACEFQSNGTKWVDSTLARSACENSSLGYCKWKEDSTAMNGQGFCDYPSQMAASAGDCNTNCKDCDFMQDPEAACLSSVAGEGIGCKWVDDPRSGEGYCVDKTKKVCDSDCFSCFSPEGCVAATQANCSWDSSFNVCKPLGFTGEICFNEVDDDSDNLVDCQDPDCAFDNKCGGNNFGGTCNTQSTQGACEATLAFNGLNCTWMTADWNPAGWCDMPGKNCDQFDNNLTACGLEPGCTNHSKFSDTFCDINKTKIDSFACWNFSYGSCSDSGTCSWVNDSWSSSGGHCEPRVFIDCRALENESFCNLNENCTWNQDPFSDNGGWCDVACFNHSLDQSACEGLAVGVCEWKDSSQMCQPEFFQFLGSNGGDGFGGCAQYNGNESGCNENNVTCYYDIVPGANNNVTTGNSGWCIDKAEYGHFDGAEGDVIILGNDEINRDIGGLVAEVGVEPYVDLVDIGLSGGDEDSMILGAGVYNMTDSLICKDYPTFVQADLEGDPIVGNGTNTTKFYWYLDTDGNDTDGCNAIGVGENDTGYEFLISLVSRNSSTGFSETKNLKRCLGGEWINTNVLVTTSKKMSCSEIGGVMVSVDLQDLGNFKEFNETTSMRVFVASADNSGSRSDPSDYIKASKNYLEGSIGFDFVDCSDPDTQKARCKNVQKFGFNVFEECQNGVDDDGNGLIDCNDPMCVFVPSCAGSNAFNFSINLNDKEPPMIIFTEVDKLSDSAFIRADTNEPSNMSLEFYLNDSKCSDLNETLEDVGSGFLGNASYKPYHAVDLTVDNLGYSLQNGTDYYYKVRVCDSSGNCGISKCANFTTRASTEVKQFIFKIDLPDGYTIDIPALNKTHYNFTENFGGNYYDVGIKTNTSVTKMMNFTIHCDNMSIGFFGVNILKPTKLDLSNAFICNSTRNLIGMNSSLKKWNKLIDDLKLGGATDYIEITIPVAYSASNTLNWTNDAGANGTDVDSFVECSGNSSQTNCKVPVSMGFSAYTVTTSVADPAGDGSDDTTDSGDTTGSGGTTTDTTTDTVTDTTNNTAGATNETTDDSSEDTGSVNNASLNSEGTGADNGTANSSVMDEEGGDLWFWLTGIVMIVVAAGLIVLSMRRN